MMKPNPSENIITYQNIILDKKAFKVQVDNARVDLTLLEFETFSYLLEHLNTAIHRRELLEKVWHIPKSIETRATDDTVKRLRRKLFDAQANVKIETIRGFGFIINTTPK